LGDGEAVFTGRSEVGGVVGASVVELAEGESLRLNEGVSLGLAEGFPDGESLGAFVGVSVGAGVGRDVLPFPFPLPLFDNFLFFTTTWPTY